MAYEKDMCLSYCRSLSSLGMLESGPGKSCNDIYELNINEASREVSAFNLLLVYANPTVIWNWSVIDTCMRIADFDTSRGDNCPTGWKNITSPHTCSTT